MPCPAPLAATLTAILLVACTAPSRPETASATTPATVAAEDALDARGLPRGAAAARPVGIVVRDVPGEAEIVLAASPRQQTGTLASPPLIVSGLGAARPRAGGPYRYTLLVEVTQPAGWRDFNRAETRAGAALAVQRLRRDRRCDAGPCAFVESVLIDLPEAALREAAGGRGLRLRLSGSGAFVEAGVPAGHAAALLAAADAR